MAASSISFKSFNTAFLLHCPFVRSFVRTLIRHPMDYRRSVQGTGKGEIPGTWTAISKVPAKGERLPEDQDGYYVWICEDDQTMSNWMTGGLVVLFLLVTCFPIWPNILKLILWYISCTALIVIILTVIVRWFLFLFVWIFGYEFWVLPNLFDEERTVVDSFKPLYSFEKTGPGQLWWVPFIPIYSGTFTLK